MQLHVGASCESRSSGCGFNLSQVESVGKIAEVVEHRKVPGTNRLKLCFEFAEHFSHLFRALAATAAGSDRCFGVV